MAMAVLAGRKERGDLSARVDCLRSELERERSRADRAVAYGARLLMRLELLENLLREYGEHRLECSAAYAVEENVECSCGLRAQWRAAQAWDQEEIGTVRTLL